jgi:hypothetical protein
VLVSWLVQDILKIGVPLTFIETALIGIQQRTHILVDDTERMRKLCLRGLVWWALAVVERGDVLAGTGAKVYDVAPVVRLLFHLLAQAAAALTNAFLSQR